MNKPSSSSPVVAALQPTSINPLGLSLIVLLLAFLGFSLVQRFGNVEEGREMLRWQNRLGLIADSRFADVDGWLGNHFRELGEVAANPSLQLYLTALMNPDQEKKSPLPPGISEEPAQSVFLRNLLAVTADRMGFAVKTSEGLKDVKANVTRASGIGLGIVDNSGKPMVTTQGLGVLDAALTEKILAAPKGKPHFIDVFRNAEGEMRIGFVLPIYPIQSDGKPEQQIARLVGIRALNDDLFRLLAQPGVTDKSLEAMLIKKEDSNVVYLSPDGASAAQDAGKASSRQFSLDTPELDAAFALSSPGVFAVKLDQFSTPVLMISRQLTNAPWVLMLHIERNLALSDSYRWLSGMKFTMGFALLALICGIIAAWWYGSSRRATLLSQQTAKLAAYSMAQERMLRLVSDSQPEPILIADAKQTVCFANRKTAERFKREPADIIGKSMTSLMGLDMAKTYAEVNESVLGMHRPHTRLHREGEGLEARTYNSTHIPLEHVPLEGLPMPTPGVLVVDQDITEVVNEKARRERILHQLINTLVRMVDARDPYSANHSQAVSIAAREVAQGLGIGAQLVETARIAGKIMNIGKIVVPSEILTKKKVLEKDEIQAVRDGLAKSVALLQGIEFDGPVVNTLRQCGERMDGKGPLGMKGEEILITARIIAAANSFVGMVSPRSYRDAMTVEMATGTLLQNVDSQFDRKVVVALINFVENKKGRETLLSLVQKAA